MEAVPELEAAGATLVVVTPQAVTRAAAWRDALNLAGARVLADPKHHLYDALGARRRTPLWVLRPRVVTAALRALLAGESFGRTRGDDIVLLGADVVTDRDGRIAFVHRAADPADRTEPARLVAIVRGL